jgi:phage-related protein
MSDFNYQPALNASFNQEPRVKKASFGDGYQQRVGDGINTMPEMHTLTFRGRKADMDAIHAFFVSKAGVLSFTWTPSAESERTYICPSWTKVRLGKNTAEISCTFEQVFE